MFNKDFTVADLKRGLNRLDRFQNWVDRTELKADEAFGTMTGAVADVLENVVDRVRNDLQALLDEKQKQPEPAKDAAPQAELSRVEKETALIKALRDAYGVEPNVGLLKSYGDSTIDDLYTFYVTIQER